MRLGDARCNCQANGLAGNAPPPAGQRAEAADFQEKNISIKLTVIAALAAGTLLAAPAAARPGLVVQGPSANGMAPLTNMGGTSGCPAWRCGFNGVSTHGLSTQTPSGVASIVIQITLPGGEPVAVR